MAADERSELRGWLARHRALIAAKCAGLTADQLARMAAPPSRLSLLGLVRHLSEMERAYLRNGVGREGLPLIYCTDAAPDGDFDGAGEADPDEAFAVWREECRLADAALDAAPSPEAVRSRLLKVITEYARHAGHADLLRERIDGMVGDGGAPE